MDLTGFLKKFVVIIDSIVLFTKKANIVNDNCSVTCPCCNYNSQSFKHWLLECFYFNSHR